MAVGAAAMNIAEYHLVWACAAVGFVVATLGVSCALWVWPTVARAAGWLFRHYSVWVRGREVK